MAILYKHTQHTQNVPDMAYEAHNFGALVPGVQVCEMPNSESTYRFLASGKEADDAALSYTLYEGKPVSQVSMEPRAQVTVKPQSHSLNVPPRVSDKSTNGRLECTYNGCDWWCGSHNEHKMTIHTNKKHGGA
jgi:hypothetical protein